MVIPMKTIGIDTNVFIYHFQGHPQFGPAAKKLITSLTNNKKKGITSVVTLIELLSLKVSDVDLKALETSYLEIPNLKTHDVNQRISIQAARIRREYGYRIADAIQLATALENKARFFITNDKGLKSFKELKVIVLGKK